MDGREFLAVISCEAKSDPNDPVCVFGLFEFFDRLIVVASVSKIVGGCDIGAIKRVGLAIEHFRPVLPIITDSLGDKYQICDQNHFHRAKGENDVTKLGLDIKKCLIETAVQNIAVKINDQCECVLFR